MWGEPAGHARLPPPGGLPSARPRLVGFWLTLGAFLGSFGVRFSVRKMRELKFDIPWNKRKRFGIKQAYGLTGMSSQSWVVENGWRAEKGVTVDTPFWPAMIFGRRDVTARWRDRIPEALLGKRHETEPPFHALVTLFPALQPFSITQLWELIPAKP